MHRASTKRAFTLIEILAVITIMSIITALLVMAAKGARQKAQLDSAKATLTFIASQIDAYKAKRGQLPPNLNPAVDDFTTEDEIYRTLKEWGFAVPDAKQLDPWGNPYVIVLDRDFGKNFPIDGSAPYNADPWDKLTHMYLPVPADPDLSKEIHLGDKGTTDAFLQGVAGGYQIFSAGPDGRLSRDNRELSTDIDGDGLSVNADNLTNW